MKIVVVSPHRDDAALSLGLSVEDWLTAGHTVQILNCFTQSAYAPYSDAESLHPNDRMSFVSATRRREDIAWNKMLGNRLRITDLDLLDAPLRLACNVDDVLTLELRPGDRAVARVAGAIAKLARAGHAIVLPLGIGAHIDHRVTRQAGVNALLEQPFAVAFYEDLPYVARNHGDSDLDMAVQSLDPAPQPFFVEPAAIDPSSRVVRKVQMVQCYDSQIDSVVAQNVASFCLRYGGRERLWVSETWQALFDMDKPTGVSAE